MQTLSEAELHVAPIILDFIENDTAENFRWFFRHMGLDVTRLPKGASGKMLLAAVVDHYTDDDGNFDPEGILIDLETWPPIANRIEELKREQRAKTKRRKPAKPRVRKPKAKKPGKAHA